MNKNLQIEDVEFVLKGESPSQQDDVFRLEGHLNLQTGKKYLLLGPSGSGKSTFFDGIAGFLEPRRGRISFDGRDFSGLKPYHRPVSLLQQSHNLFSHLSGLENLEIIKKRSADKENFDKNLIITLRKLQIEDLQNRRANRLSGGEKIRFALARIILENQPILLLDEPFSSLGPALRNESRDFLSNILKNSNKIAILSSHLSDDLSAWPDEVIWINNGIIHAPKPVKLFFEDADIEAKRYLGV